MFSRLRSRSTIAGVTAVTVAASLLIAQAVSPVSSLAAPKAAAAPSVAQPVATDRLVRPADVLPSDYAKSGDLAWRTVGDSSGLHVIAATEASGYAWRTVATLSEPGFDTDRWVGQGCLTTSGRRVVVVYAPRSFTNDALLTARGAFTAVVDLQTGGVRKLALRTSLAYFNPGCGVGENAVLTQEGDEQLPGTRLSTVNAATGVVGTAVITKTQVSSAIPTSTGIVGGSGNYLVKVGSAGQVKSIVATTGTPFDLTVDATGAVVHADHAGNTVRYRRTAGTATSTLGTGSLTSTDVQRGTSGAVFLTGPVQASALPAGVTIAADVTPQQQLSSTGQLAVSEIAPASNAVTGQAQAKALSPDQQGAKPNTSAPVSTSVGDQIKLTGRVRSTGKSVSFSIAPGQAPGSLAATGTTSPASHAAVMSPATAGSPTNPIDQDGTCAIPRNDATEQVYQPTPRQAEWAADQAVRGALTVSRPAGWRNDGLAAYTPQSLFPATALNGGGYIPAQIMLGILAQESNMWQASNHAESGEYGNPEIGNYYGRQLYDSDPNNDWQIDFSKADCGYGIAQVTDGMRATDTTRTATQKKAIALDYAANIEAGQQILASKWNQLAAKSMKVNDGTPQWIENWYLALWAYNSGIHNLGDAGTDGTTQGLGWANNPANPHYPPSRLAFLEYTYADAAHPQDWPYQEKVIGFAGHPIDTLDGPGYRAAWWTSVDNRVAAQPPVNIACTTANQCLPGQKFTPNDPAVVGEPAGPCSHKSPAGLYNLQCFWHSSMTWKANCASTGACGNELERFDPGQYPEQPDGTNFPPSCTATSSGTLPSNAVIVDDVASTVPGYRCATRPKNGGGTFSLSFKADSSSKYESKIDFHQLGGGYGGHFWFAHTQPLNSLLTVTGTWKPTTRLAGWNRVMVHIPDHGALTQQAHYVIHLGNGTTENRIIPTDIEKNSWVSLGVFNFVAGTDTPSVSLSNYADDGTGDADVAWDAAAFLPLTAKPANFIVQVGDSYSSGEGAEPYLPGSDRGNPADGNGANSGTPTWNACRRSQNSWIRKAILPAGTTSIGSLSDSLNATMDMHSVACSGAYTFDVDPGDTGFRAAYGQLGNHHEIDQIDSGFLDANTTLVALTLGGNDANFSSTMQSCANPIGGCPDYSKVTSDIDTMKPKLVAVLKGLHRVAPNAKIVLLGYPEIFNVAKAPCGKSVMPASQMPDVNSFADYMVTAQQSAVTTAKAAGGTFVFHNPTPEFTGKLICDDTEGINDFVSAPTGPGDFSCPVGIDPSSWLCASMETYHPNNTGTTLYATAFQNALH